MGVTEGKYDYEPFGKKMVVLDNQNRLTFIGKENDFESNFGDFGVRKYDDETGRFISVDALWEKYYPWSPYHYCRNNPLVAVDPSGFFAINFSQASYKQLTNLVQKVLPNLAKNTELVKKMAETAKINQKYIIEQLKLNTGNYLEVYPYNPVKNTQNTGRWSGMTTSPKTEINGYYIYKLEHNSDPEKQKRAELYVLLTLVHEAVEAASDAAEKDGIKPKFPKDTDLGDAFEISCFGETIEFSEVEKFEKQIRVLFFPDSNNNQGNENNEKTQ